VEDRRSDTARQLFVAWSSGDPDAPRPFLHDDAVLSDIVGGEFQGWTAIRAFFAHGLERWSELVLTPEEIWTNDEGIALRWTMTAVVPDDRFGAGNEGRRWRSPGMSYLVFRGDKVAREVDYHDSAAVARSLGLTAEG
jgi:ketosteroid isomerase-like protein